MLNVNLKETLGRHEGINLEYKAVVPPPSIIARNISAFANSEGGVIICGVNDNYTVKGIEVDVPAFQTVESALSRLEPRPSVNHYLIEVDGRNLYVIEVAKSDQKIITEGKAIYQRIGSQVVIAPPAVIEREIQGGKNRQLTQLLATIEESEYKATESRIRFLEQYKNLIRLVNRSSNILYPDTASVLTEVPEGKVLIRLILSSFADTFEGYLADLLYEIYLAKPETLKSNSSITTQDVLSCQSIEEIVRFIASKKISGLKKGNVSEFIDDNKQIKGLNVFSVDVAKRINDIFQIRHLYIHNNGRIDIKYLNHSPGKYKLGDEHLLTLKELCEVAELLINIVGQLDQAAITTYGLSTSG